MNAPTPLNSMDVQSVLPVKNNIKAVVHHPEQRAQLSSLKVFSLKKLTNH